MRDSARPLPDVAPPSPAGRATRTRHVMISLDLLESGGAQRQAVELASRFQAEPGWRCSVLVYVEAEFFARKISRDNISRERSNR